MKKNNEHIIEKQEIVLNLNGNVAENDQKSIQDAIIKLYKNVIGEKLDKIFSLLVPEDIDLRIDNLDIELPLIEIVDFSKADEISELVLKSFEKIARKTIESKIKKIAGNKIEKNAAGETVISKWHILEKFLEDGHYPGLLSTKNESVEKIFEELIQQSAAKMSDLINKMTRRNREKILNRIVYQFHNKNLNKIVAILYQKNGKEALRIIENIRKNLGQRYQALRGQKSVNKAIFAAALDYVLRQTSKGQSLKFSEKDLTQFIIDAIQKKYKHVDENDLGADLTGVKNEFNSQYADLDVIEYFLLNGSVPYWASTESQQSVQDLFTKIALKKLSSLQRMIGKHLENEIFIKRLLLQFGNEQIFMLLEPLSVDHRRFLEDLSEEFNNSEFDFSVVLETALLQIIGGKGKFSKLEITKEALERISNKTNSNFENLLDNFYSKLRAAALKEYNLTRNELLRILNEIKPDTQDRLENYLASYQQQKESEMDLMEQIEYLEEKIKKTVTDSEEHETLKKEQKALVQALSKLMDQAQKSGIDKTDSAREFAEKRKELEIQLNSLNFKLFKIKEEKNSDTQKSYFENLIKIAEEELKKLKQSFDKYFQKIIKKASTENNSEEKNKLNKELEYSLALLIQEKNKLQNMITDIESEAANIKDGRIKISLEGRKEKLSAELKKTEDKIKEVKALLEKIKPAETDIKEDGSENSKLDFMIFFLQYGSIPWWAEKYREQSISSIFSEFSVDNPEKLRQAFSRVGRNPVVWQRLINQLEEVVLEKVLLTLFPNFAGFAISLAIMMEKIFESGIIESLKNIPLKYFKWSKIAEVLFREEGRTNPQNFIKEVIKESSRAFNVAPSSLLFYINNLSNNNPEGRLGIFADIISPLNDNEELVEIEKELLQSALRKKQEDEGVIIPEEKKYDTLSDYVLKGVYADFTWKGGLNNPAEMEKLFWELLEKQNSATEILIEKALENTLSRRRLSLEFSEDSFWEIVWMKGPKTLPLSRNYLKDLGNALGDDKMFFAREALLRTIFQDRDKPFVMEEYLFQLVKEAAQITKRMELAIINEWKRKVYQLENPQSAILLHLMQVELRHLKSKSDNSEDPSEKENLLQQMKSLQVEYQQQSQQLMYIYNKEQPQLFPDFEIPESPVELYRKIEETISEIEKIKQKFEENPNGENLLDQIISMRQLAGLEGQLEVLRLYEPLQVRQLNQLEQNLQVVIEKEEKELAEIPFVKNVVLPALPEKTELDELADYIEEDKEKLKEIIQNIKPEDRVDWIEILKENDREDILRDWNITDNERTNNLSKLSLDELIKLQSEIPDYEDKLNRRINGRIKVLIARELLALKKEHKQLLSEIENAETTEKAESLRKDLLAIELRQNDRLDEFLSKVKDERIKFLLSQLRNNLQLTFKRIRSVADMRKSNILNERKERQKQFINLKKAEKEQIEQKRKVFIEQIKSNKKETVKPKKEERKKKPEKAIDEPLYIKNAGLVILHPFFNRLFTNLNLVVKNKFVSEEAQIRAVHILQYIATGKTEHPENELVLNKIICGLPLSTPVPMDIGLTEDEIKVSNGLLNGAIANWPRMKTMSPDAFRGTFILREGNIKEESDRWKLKVEKGSFDILLKTIPWAFTFIRSGWMPKFIMVEWQLPG